MFYLCKQILRCCASVFFYCLIQGHECLSSAASDGHLPVLSVCAQATQHGYCMTHMVSLWISRPSSLRRKACRLTWPASRRRRRPRRSGDDYCPRPSCWRDSTEQWLLRPVLPRVSVLQYCTLSQNQESRTCCLNKPTFTLQTRVNPLLFD